jgi:hypothetical protein
MERLAAKRCQVCLIDPEGDFEEAEEFSRPVIRSMLPRSITSRIC